ncbi:MAG TPA: class I SAM-dependent methyltransferase [Pyrinomonadaceae bacterium]
MNSEQTVEQVAAFWDTEACGTQFVARATDERDFYTQYRRFRYETEWHIPEFVPFTEMRGQRVLEIGCGNGADGVMFAQHGAHYTGVDLTAAAVAATRKHFTVMNLPGEFRLADAEQLDFADESFDTVYSYGVLHHTPRPARAIREVHRVLRPGGRAFVMLYHRHSFNYYARILGYMRARVLLRILARAAHWSADRQAVRAKELAGLRGNESKAVWALHYENFLRTGWAYLRARNFVHHCTDGPECPYAYAYSRREARQLFAPFTAVKFRVAHFPLRKYRFARALPFAVERLLAARLGWYLLIEAVK